MYGAFKKSTKGIGLLIFNDNLDHLYSQSGFLGIIILRFIISFHYGRERFWGSRYKNIMDIANKPSRNTGRATSREKRSQHVWLYIRYVFKISKRHLTFIKRPGRHLISLKNLISIS